MPWKLRALLEWLWPTMLLLMAAASGLFSSADVEIFKMSLSDQEVYLGSRDGDQRDVVSGGGGYVRLGLTF